MKNITLTIVFSFVTSMLFAQSNEAPKRLKYVTQAPDGSVAMTIYDDSRNDNMQLESASTFYKYQILDPATSEPILSADNKGNVCLINKNKVAAGTYNIRLFTQKFVITSKITVSDSIALRQAAKEETLAMNEKE